MKLNVEALEGRDNPGVYFLTAYIDPVYPETETRVLRVIQGQPQHCLEQVTIHPQGGPLYALWVRA